MNKLQNKKIILPLVSALALVGLVFWFISNDRNEGKSYKSKQVMCIDFAQSYLKTVQKTDMKSAQDDPKKWSLAVAVESDLYNLCLLDLNKDSLKSFDLGNIKRELENSNR
jgi:hypothetical protein